jgi:hypothetical protein
VSYTEIYKFNKIGNAEFIGETQNSHLFHSSVWAIIEEKYLEPFIPEWSKSFPSMKKDAYFRSSTEDMYEIWNVFDSKEISDIDRIVLGATFDNMIIKREDLPELIEAFKEFYIENVDLIVKANNNKTVGLSIGHIAEIVQKEMEDDPEMIAVGFGISLNGDNWEIYEDSNDECRPYNLFFDKKHHDLFEHIKETVEKHGK